MSTENDSSPDRTDGEPQVNGLPSIEDAYEPDEPKEPTLGEDDPRLLGTASRALEPDETQAEDAEETPQPSPGSPAAERDDASDTGTLTAEPGAPVQTVVDHELQDWDNELSAHKIVVELKRVESQVRRLLEDRDHKRKRKLGGTRRWLELEEDLINWRHSGRFDEATLRDLSELVARRNHLFRRLRFLAGTRPTWNT